MSHQLYELYLGQLANTIEDLTKQVTVLEALIEIEAKQLSKSFKEARKNAKDQLGEATTKEKHKAQFAPLLFHTRLHKGSLEINWSLLKAKTKPNGASASRPIYHNVAKGKGFGYRLPDLMSLSRDYEQVLVLEAEQKAVVLRELWSKIVNLRVSIRTLSRLCEEKTNPVEKVEEDKREGLAAELAVQGDERERRRLADAEKAAMTYEFDKTHLGASTE